MGRRERRLQARKILVEHDEAPKNKRTGPVGAFFDKHYHKLQIIPAIILLLAIGYNVAFFVNTGDFVKKGVSLSGGTTVTVSSNAPFDEATIKESFAKYPEADINVRILRSGGSNSGFVVEAANLDSDANAAEKILVNHLKQFAPDGTFSSETTGPSLGQAFFIQTLFAICLAFVFMSAVVFISFRTFYPSAAVVLAGFSTVISTLAVFNFLGYRLSTAGIAAFLMLIGYSIDTDILLSTRVLKGKTTFIENVWSAAKTGLTMQMTTALVVLTIFLLSNNEVFSQISVIILIGMFFDVLYTWFQNAPILQWYTEKHR